MDRNNRPLQGSRSRTGPRGLRPDDRRPGGRKLLQQRGRNPRGLSQRTEAMNRLIREDVLTSERVCKQTPEGRWLFMAILLKADDAGLFEATSFDLSRAADLRRDHVDLLLQQLADCDLVRLYEVKGKRYGFVPRYGQEKRHLVVLHPLPPAALIADDDHAVAQLEAWTARQAK